VEITQRLAHIEQIELLRALHRRSITAASLAEFEQFLATIH
jgi:hypothetical protein